jgi:magnesium transporter
MLTIYSAVSRTPTVWSAGTAVVGAALWIDLIEPTAEETRQAEDMLGSALPTRDQTSAIELSSRLRASKDVLCLNIPAFVRADAGLGLLTPLGFVLTPTLLASVRYAESEAFVKVAATMGLADGPRSAVDVFIGLLESIVDVSADRIEGVASDLSRLSRAVFDNGRGHQRLVQAALFKVGAMQRQITQIRSALLGVSRVATYLCEVAPPWIDAKLQSQFKTLQADIGSLTEFDQQLGDRVQFVLDAVLGFINNYQNDIMRVLTVVSVATMPPMILAGIWGMNFKSIPEYDWKHGYAFGLTMIALSMALPLIWFKIKKWI